MDHLPTQLLMEVLFTGEAEQHQEEEDHHQLMGEEDHHQLMGEDSHQHHLGTFTTEATQDPEHPYRVTHLVIRVLHHLRLGFPLGVSLPLRPDQWLQLLRRNRSEYFYGSLISRHTQNTKELRTGPYGYSGSRTLCSPKG